MKGWLVGSGGGLINLGEGMACGEWGDRSSTSVKGWLVGSGAIATPNRYL